MFYACFKTNIRPVFLKAESARFSASAASGSVTAGNGSKSIQISAAASAAILAVSATTTAIMSPTNRTLSVARRGRENWGEHSETRVEEAYQYRLPSRRL